MFEPYRRTGRTHVQNTEFKGCTDFATAPYFGEPAKGGTGQLAAAVDFWISFLALMHMYIFVYIYIQYWTGLCF